MDIVHGATRFLSRSPPVLTLFSPAVLAPEYSTNQPEDEEMRKQLEKAAEEIVQV